MKRSYSALVIAVLSLVTSGADAAGAPRVVSVREAEKLILEALPLQTRQLPSFSLERGTDDRGYYFFFAVWAGVPNGSTMIGGYAVDSATGDVFDAVSDCNELSTPALRKLQAQIRRRIGLSDAKYNKIKQKGPLCS
jgi:hypothetical protein